MTDWIKVDRITKEHVGWEVTRSAWGKDEEEEITAVGKERFLSLLSYHDDEEFWDCNGPWLVRKPRPKPEVHRFWWIKDSNGELQVTVPCKKSRVEDLKSLGTTIIGPATYDPEIGGFREPEEDR